MEKIAAVVFLFVSLFNVVQSQDLVTDRPDYTESAQVVPHKSIQIESGMEFSRASSEKSYSIPNLLLRYGLSDRIEARLALPGWSRITVGSSTATYLNDVGVEAKLALSAPESAVPICVILGVTFPTGADEVSSGASEWGLKLAAAKDLTDRLGLGWNIGAYSVPVASDRRILSLASAALGYSINDRWGAFFEVFAEKLQDQPMSPVLDLGATFSSSPLLQLDFYTGFGLNAEAPDVILGLGLSLRN